MTRMGTVSEAEPGTGPAPRAEDSTHVPGAVPHREAAPTGTRSQPHEITAPLPASEGTPVPAQLPVKTQRAGRNLPAALAVGLSLGVTLILVLVFVPTLLFVMLSAAVGIATWEVAKRLREADVLVPRTPLLAGGQAIIWLSWPYGATGVAGAFGATVLTCMMWRLFDPGAGTPPRNYLRDMAISVFVVAWIPLLASFAALMLVADKGNFQVLAFMIGVVCSDVGGYAAGVLFGRHPMAPRVSPKKSWEGLVGSLIACVIGGLLSVTLLLGANPLIGVALGIALALVSTAGDLVESQIKRDLGIKDMGTLLPGHGGMMDRLDSMLPSAFVSWLVFTLLL